MKASTGFSNKIKTYDFNQHKLIHQTLKALLKGELVSKYVSYTRHMEKQNSHTYGGNTSKANKQNSATGSTTSRKKERKPQLVLDNAMTG